MQDFSTGAGRGWGAYDKPLFLRDEDLSVCYQASDPGHGTLRCAPHSPPPPAKEVILMPEEQDTVVQRDGSVTVMRGQLLALF